MCVIALQIHTAEEDIRVYKVLVSVNGRYYPAFYRPKGTSVHYIEELTGTKMKEATLTVPFSLEPGHYEVKEWIGHIGDERGGYCCFQSVGEANYFIAICCKGQQDLDGTYVPLKQSKAMVIVPFLITAGTKYVIGKIKEGMLGSGMVALRAEKLIYTTDI